MGDEKRYKKIVAVVLILLSINTWLLWRLNSENKQLKIDVMNMNNSLSQSIYDLYRQVDDIDEEIGQTLTKQASMVEDVVYEVECKEGRCLIDMWITPKVIREDEKVILGVQVEDEWVQKEATIQEDMRYKASFEIPFVDEINAKMMLNVGDEMKQEALDGMNITKWLSLEYEAIWGDYTKETREDERDLLYITLYNQNREGSAVLQEGDQIMLKVIDSYENEVGQIPLKKVGHDAAMHKELMMKGIQNMSYVGDAREYMDKEEDYFFVLDIQTQGGVQYKEQVARYRGEKNSSTRDAGGGNMYPVWD